MYLYEDKKYKLKNIIHLEHLIEDSIFIVVISEIYTR